LVGRELMPLHGLRQDRQSCDEYCRRYEGERQMSSDNRKYKWVGTRQIRPDGHDKVTGRAKFGSDFSLSGMIHGRVLRSPHAHAVIKSIDTSKA
jgi:xanthine dehydrogenase molybdopterin-binding subunit B